MIIYQSKIIERDSFSYLETVFETKNKTETLWYKIPSQYKDQLTTQNLDAAVVGLLVLAMKNNEDIIVKGTLSSKLNYTLNNYLIKALHLSNNAYHEIKVIPETTSTATLNNGKNIATGISCGIDSFSTIATHTNTRKQYDVNYLTYFNAGSHGKFQGEIAKKLYAKRLNNVEQFVQKVGLPLLKLDTNVYNLVGVDFQKLHSIYHISCVLALQKGISTYYYSSAFRFDYFKLNKNDTSDWDNLLIGYLQTESTQFYSSMAQYNRFERTEIVAHYKPSYNYLDVCTSYTDNAKINCSKCDKCMRTQLSLELLGKLENYRNVFNIEIYKKYKDTYIGKLLYTKEKHQINKDLYLKLEEKNMIKPKHYIINTFPTLKKRISRFIKK
ncbi:hypothetical protein [Pontimicrobium sp. MEBiC06410]